GVDEDRQHTKRLVLFDKAHTAHVGRQVVDVDDITTRGGAGGLLLQIGSDVFSLGEELMPFGEGLYVHRAHTASPLAEERADKVAADEAAGAGNQNDVLGHGDSSC